VEPESLLAAVEESLDLKRSFFEEQAATVLEAGSLLVEAFRAKRKLLVFGNGGSAADAQHFAAELVNRFRYDRPGLPAIALTTDSSILTSVGNDLDFQSLFSRQIEALGVEGDVACAISTSGHSPNVIKGVEAARDRGLRTLGLAGRDGGKLATMVDLSLTVPHRETSRVQEVHAMLIHFLCQIVEESLFPRDEDER
jgi:D-sedoheptulose 7-phosphate isomerase